MKSFLTSARLVTKLQMLRSGKKSKAFVVVEGITDFRLYRKMVALNQCEVVIGESKQNVVEAMKICKSQKLGGIIGIVDADFWHLEKREPDIDNIFLTDGHDLEVMLICSKAFEDVLLEYGDVNKIARFEGRMKKSLRDILCENIAHIGYLRKLSLDYKLEFGFGELNYMDFTYVSNLEIQKDKLINYLVFRSKKQSVRKSKEIEKLLDEIIKPEDNLWQVCCGHDLMELMTIGLVHLFGNYNAKKIIPGQLEGSFRLAYQTEYFRETKLYKDIKNWELENEPYKIFISEKD